MKKMLVSSAVVALLLSPDLLLSGRAEAKNPGCQNRIADGFRTPAQINAILYLPVGSSVEELFAIAPPTCTLEETFGQPGEANHSVFAYAVYDSNTCYLRVQVDNRRLTSARKVCP
ncbi:MAG: hypothetical protein ACAF41_34310 (plasmid) [Leptolyngbya sp. BL-A-14]